MYCWRNYDVIENAIFYYIRGDKTGSIPDNNFNKFKRTFIFLVGNINKVMCNCWCTDSPPRLISDDTLPCETEHFRYSYKIPRQNKQKCRN